MLLSEWNIEDAKVAWQEEAIEIGVMQGRERRELEIARNALSEGFSFEAIQRITGLGRQTIEGLNLKS